MRELDWGRIVQCLLRIMDHAPKGQNSREQAEAMASAICRTFEMESTQVDDLFNRAFRQEIDNILQSFLEKKRGGGPPTIAKYDLPNIADLIAKRIVHRMNAMKEPTDTGSVT